MHTIILLELQYFEFTVDYSHRLEYFRKILSNEMLKGPLLFLVKARNGYPVDVDSFESRFKNKWLDLIWHGSLD